MGNLAVALARGGWRVGGSDRGAYPPISSLLEAAGISVDSPEDTGVLEKWEGALFIVGNAVSRGHRQLEALMCRPSSRMVSFPAFLGETVLARTANLVVAGTHGKSTTSAAAAQVLRDAGCNAGWFVGGVLADGSPALTFSRDDRFFVIEGDEYDSAFFDKRAKFVHYRPQVLLLNNLEFDHADIYRDTADVQRAFRQALALVPGDGTILFNGDDPALSAILPVPWARCLSFGEGPRNDFGVSRPGSGSVAVESSVEGLASFRIRTALSGAFNARNLAGAVLGARLLVPGLSSPEIVDLSGFKGLKRRQEILFRDRNRILMEDFGHHPTALGAALEALREGYPGWRIHAMVEPHSNTMRTNRLADALVAALAGADRVSLAPVHRAGSVPEAERLDPRGVAAQLAASGVECRLCPAVEELPEAFLEGLRGEGGVLTVVFTNGSFGGMIPRLIEILRETQERTAEDGAD